MSRFPYGWFIVAYVSALLSGCSGHWLPFTGGLLLGCIAWRCVVLERRARAPH